MWLGLSLDGGETTAGSVLVGDPPADIIVGFDATGISAGTYTADIIVASNDPANPTGYPVPMYLLITQSGQVNYIFSIAFLQLPVCYFSV